MSNNNQRPDDRGAGTQSSGAATSKKDVAAEQSKAEGEQLKNEAAQSGQRVKETAKDQAAAAKDEATHQAKDLAGQLKENVQGYVRPQQERLASTVRSVSNEIDAISQGKQPESDYVSSLLGSASGTVDSLASSLENKDAQDLLSDVRRFAARRPGTFLAIAAGIGLLAGRATRGAKDSDEIGNNQDEGSLRDHHASDTYAYSEQPRDTAPRTYTDEVPGSVYPDQAGERR